MYWVRRVLVLAVALILVVGLGMLLTGGSDGSDRATDQTAVQASAELTGTAAAETATATASTTPEARKPKKKNRKKPAPLAVPDGECDPAEIVVEPVVNQAVAGRDITIWLRLSTTDRPACTWHLDQSSLAVKITSGKDAIWFSADCPRAVPDLDVVVREQKDRLVRLVWDARRSDEGCTQQREWVLEGYYHVEAAAMGGEPTDTQFEVTLPTPRTVTVSPSPTETTTKDARNNKKPTAGKDRKATTRR